MYDGTRCIWPNCMEPTLMSPTRWLCSEHVQAVVEADRAARGRRIRRRSGSRNTGGLLPKQPGLSYFEQKKRDSEAQAARDELSAMEHPGYIYYLRIGGHYKIGWAKRLADRFKAYPPDSQVLAVHEGSRTDEGKLHKRFAHLTTAGREWYPLVPDITRHIDVMVEQHGKPDPELRCGPKPTGVRRPSGQSGPSPRYWTGKRSA